MRAARIAGGSILVLVGTVWSLQGLGSTFVPVSFMTNARIWIVIGIVTVLAGSLIVVRSLRRSEK